jgi:hypothetical protein
VALAEDRRNTGKLRDLILALFFATPRCFYITLPDRRQFDIEFPPTHCFGGIG